MRLFCQRMHWVSSWNPPSSSTFHLNNGFLMIWFPVIHCCIDLRNFLTYIPNFLCLLSIINLRPSTLIWLKIPPMMISTTSPTLQWFSIVAFIMLLHRMRPISFLIYLELLIRGDIFLLTCILRSSSLLKPFSFALLITFWSYLNSGLCFDFS